MNQADLEWKYYALWLGLTLLGLLAFLGIHSFFMMPLATLPYTPKAVNLPSQRPFEYINVTVEYIEPVREEWQAQLAYTQAYWCAGEDCTNWAPYESEEEPGVRKSEDGNGGKTHSMHLALLLPASKQGFPLQWVRIKVTAIDIYGRETDGEIRKILF